MPTEGELLALMVGLLMLEEITYGELRERELVFREEHQSQLSELFEYRLPELAREFGSSEDVRQRLSELVGVRVTRSADRIVP